MAVDRRRRLGTVWFFLAAGASAQQADKPAAKPPAPPRDTQAAELSITSSEPLAATTDEVAILVENLVLRLRDRDLELRADRAVLWGDADLRDFLRTAMKGGDDPLRFGPEIPTAPGRPPPPRARTGDSMSVALAGLREVYAEGHVFFREGPEKVLLADRLYQHLLEHRGVIVGADAYGRDEYRGGPQGRPRVVDVHVRANKLRALGPQEFGAEKAEFSTCPYGHPHWHVRSETLGAKQLVQPDGTETTQLALGGNLFESDDVPLLPLPNFTTNLQQGSSIPLKKLRAGHSKKFGTFAESTWGASLPDEADELRQEFELEKPLELNWEAAVDYYSRRGPGLGPGFDWHSPGLIDGDLSAYWVHDGADEDFSIPAPIDNPNRGRVDFRNRLTPVEHWRLDTELHWLSDAGFQPEYFEKEFKEAKEPETYAHLVRQEDVTRFRMLYRNRLNDFQTQNDSLPQATFDQIGLPLWKLELPGFFGRDGQTSYLVLSHQEDVGNYRFHPAEDSGQDPERVVRGDSEFQLSTTVPIGPVGLRPFAGIELTGWDRGANDNSNLGRTALVAGARSEFMMHRDYDAWVPAISLDGLRHVMLFDVDYTNVYYASRSPDEFIPIDNVEKVNEREVYLVAWRQRLQTHRGVSTEDAFSLDLELPLYPHAERDNFGPEAGNTTGETTGPLKYDFLHRPGFDNQLLRHSLLFADGEWNLHDETMDVYNLGVQLQGNTKYAADMLTPDWVTIVSWRVARGISHVLSGEIDWRLTDKWSLAVLEQYDLDANNGLENRYELRRIGHDFTFALSVERDHGDGDVSVAFSVYPSFLWHGNAERGLQAGRGSTPTLLQGQ